jgi:hypothetical protein
MAGAQKLFFDKILAEVLCPVTGELWPRLAPPHVADNKDEIPKKILNP